MLIAGLHPEAILRGVRILAFGRVIVSDIVFSRSQFGEVVQVDYKLIALPLRAATTT